MPDSAGFGDFNGSGVVIPALFEGKPVNFTAQMYLDDEPPIAGGREITDIQVHGAWSGPARRHLVPHVNAPVADLPVRGIVGGLRFIADLTLPCGRVLHDYLAT